MKRHILVFAAIFIIGAIIKANADYVIKDANTTTQTVFAFVCSVTKICPASVPIDSTGADMTDTTLHALKVSGIGVTPGTAFSTQTQDFVGGLVNTATPLSWTDGTIRPVSQTTDGGLRTAPTAPTYTVMQNGAVATGAGVAMNVQTYGTVTAAVDCTVSCVGITVSWQVSEDNTNWGPQVCTQSGYNTPSTTATPVGTGWTFYSCNITHPYTQLRANITAYSSGTITINGFPTTSTGPQSTQIARPFALPENAVGGTVSGTTGALTLIAASGTGLKTYVTDYECGRTDTGTTNITLTFNDAYSTVIVLPASGGQNKSFNTPLQTAANTALTVTLSATVSGGNVVCSAQGYKAP